MAPLGRSVPVEGQVRLARIVLPQEAAAGLGALDPEERTVPVAVVLGQTGTLTVQDQVEDLPFLPKIGVGVGDLLFLVGVETLPTVGWVNPQELTVVGAVGVPVVLRGEQALLGSLSLKSFSNDVACLH